MRDDSINWASQALYLENGVVAPPRGERTASEYLCDWIHNTMGATLKTAASFHFDVAIPRQVNGSSGETDAT